MTPVSLLIAAPALSYGLCENAEVIIFLLQLFDFVFNRVIDEPVVKKNGATSWTVTVATTTWLEPTFPLEMPDGFVLQLVKLPPWRSRLSERWSIYWKFHVRTNFNLNRWNLLNRIANYWNRCTIFYRVKLNLKLKYFLHFRRSRTFVSLKHFVDYQDEVF